MTENGYVKRPQPKVLDADGVEINVGDTVWCVNHLNSPSHTVTEIDESGYITTNILKFQHPENFTHKEPDSLEKLRDDMKHVTADFDVTYGDMQAWVDRLSALIKRGA